MVNLEPRGNQVIPGIACTNPSIAVHAEIKYFSAIEENVSLRHTTAWLKLKA